MAAPWEEADALAFFFWPPRWVASAPSTNTDADLGWDQFPETVFESSLPGDLRMKVSRDGMVVWDFTAWGGNPSLSQHLGKGGTIDPEPEIKAQIRCLRLMNAHLACLLQSIPNSLERPQVLTPNHFLKVRFSDCSRWVGNADDPGSYWLAIARKRGSSASEFRQLVSQRPVLRVESLQGADELLRQLLERESSEMALFRVESIYRSVVAYRDFDHGGALVNAWVAIEGLLGDLFARYLKAEGDRSGEVGTFIDSERRRFLEGSTVSSRLTAEILSLADYLPHRLYRELRACAKARNS